MSCCALEQLKRLDGLAKMDGSECKLRSIADCKCSPCKTKRDAYLAFSLNFMVLQRRSPLGKALLRRTFATSPISICEQEHN
jgi:hypothetical protein